MKIKKIGIALLWSLCIIAQPKMSAQKRFTLEELNFGGSNYRNMVPQNRYTTWWGNELVRTDANFCTLIDKNTGKELRLFDVDSLNNWAGTSKENKVHSLYHVLFPYSAESLVLVNNGKERQLINWKTKRVVWKQSALNQTATDWNSASRAVAFVRDNNLYITDKDGNTRQLIT